MSSISFNVQILMIGCRTSATNCAHLYNASLVNTEVTPRDVDWPFSFMVSDEHVWDAFVILALLEDCKRHSTLLTVPHTGLQKDWFTDIRKMCSSFCKLQKETKDRFFTLLQPLTKKQLER